MEAIKRVDAPTGRFVEQPLVLVMIDLAGFTRAVADLPAVEIAELLERYYELCGERVAAHGGRVVKFEGDSCLATFEPDLAREAVACAVSLREDVLELGRVSQLDLDMGANLHLARVVAGTFGFGTARGDDVMGMGVIHTFRMASGPGVRISEPVYRKLPSDQRSPWHKHQPPATYTWAG